MPKSSKETAPDLTNALEEFNQFNIQDTVQSIWKESDVEVKKQRLIDEVINQFKFKEKQLYFIGRIKQCKKSQDVDRILGNIVLYGEGLCSIKF